MHGRHPSMHADIFACPFNLSDLDVMLGSSAKLGAIDRSIWSKYVNGK
jgi:hypothetical protein